MRSFPAVDVVWGLVMVAVIGGLAWFGFRMEPHWVAKDGKAFTCRIQPIGPHGQADGRWREARAFINDEGQVVVRGRGAFSPVKLASSYQVIRHAETPPKGRVVYLVQETGGRDLAALRIPANSRAVEHLDATIKP